VNAADLISQVKQQPRLRMEVGLLLDGTAFAEARRLQDKLSRIQAMPDDDDVTAEGVTEIAERLVQIYRDTPETTFTLEALSASEWEALHREHDDAQKFVIALFAACCVEPEGWTVETATELKGTLTAGQWATLVLAMQQLNEGLFDLRPTRAATALTNGMRRNSTTAPLEESDIPIS
jgi:hypothetical protein